MIGTSRSTSQGHRDDTGVSDSLGRPLPSRPIRSRGDVSDPEADRDNNDNNNNREAPFGVYYGRTIVNQREGPHSAAPCACVMLLSPVHLNMDSRRLVNSELMPGCDSSVPEDELSQHPLNSDVDATLDNCGIPEIYLLPSTTANRNDNSDGRASKSTVADEDFEWSDREEHIIPSPFGSPSDGLDSMQRDAFFFRDTPRGEPMGSENAFQTPAAQIGQQPGLLIEQLSESSDSDREDRLPSVSEDAMSSHRPWLREDVEGADSNTDNVRLDQFVDVDVVDSVRPPLVGQSEDSRDAANAVASAVQIQDVSSVVESFVQSQSMTRTFTSRPEPVLDEAVRIAMQPLAAPHHSRSIDKPEVASRPPDVPVTLRVQSRRHFYNSLGDDEDDNGKQFSSVESTDNEQAPATKGSGYQSDHRASSPSVISVASSVASSKRLEWDSGADIGYDGPKVLYGKLSTLERMAIGSFFRRTEPEGKSALVKDRIGIRPADGNNDRRPGISLQREPAVAAAAASLEDVVLSITDGTEVTVDQLTSEFGDLTELSGQSAMMNEDDDQDTEDEIAECYRKNSAFKDNRAGMMDGTYQAEAPRITIAEEHAKNETFRVRVHEHRSSSMTDLSRSNRVSRAHKSLTPTTAVRQSRSALDITGECSRHHNRLVPSPGSMVGSSSSSSTVVGAVPPSAFQPNPYATIHSTPFVRGPLCSTALHETPYGFPGRPSFHTPASGVSTSVSQPSSRMATTDEITECDSFDRKLMQTRQLIAQLGTDPRWATQRRWLVETLLEAAGECQPYAAPINSGETSGSVIPSEEDAGDAEGREVSVMGTSRTELSVKSVPCLDRPLDSLVGKDGKCVPHESNHKHQSVHSSVENVNKDKVGESIRNSVPQSKTNSSCTTSQRSTSSADSPYLVARGTASATTRSRAQPRCYTSVSSSDRSESTLDTIREQRRRDPHRYHHHHHHHRQQQDQAEVSGGTLASSFEFYAVPMSFRGVPRYVDDGLMPNVRRSSQSHALFKAANGSRSSISSVHLTTTTTTSAITNSEESPSETAHAAATVAAVSYTSETSSNVCVKSPRRKTTTTTATVPAPMVSIGESLNLEGLSAVKKLVRRQRESYVRKLRREMDWLERIEAILFGNYSGRRPPSDGLVERVPESLALLRQTTTARPKRIIGSSAPKNGQSTPGFSTSNPSKRNDKVVHSAKSRTKDFGQCFPTPQLSENELWEKAQEKEGEDVPLRRSNSVAIQTSESIIDSQFRKPSSKCKRSRPIVNIPLTVTTQVKNKRTPSVTCGVKRYSGRPACRHPPVSWFVPIIGNTVSKRKGLKSSSRQVFTRGRADGANSTVGSLVPVLATRDLSLQEAFRLYKSDVIQRLTARQAKVKEREQSRLHAGPRIPQAPNKVGSFKRATKPLPISVQHHNPQIRMLTERQMRDHTEKLYQALSEVVERQELKRREDSYRTNRQMAEMFKKKLQEKVLSGKVSIPMTHKCT